MATLVGIVDRRMGCFIVYRENIQLLGINVCCRQHNYGSSIDNDSDSDLTDMSKLAEPLAE
jgi:hypothetical protein